MSALVDEGRVKSCLKGLIIFLALGSAEAAAQGYSHVEWEPFEIVKDTVGKDGSPLVMLISEQAWPMRNVAVGLGCSPEAEAVIIGSEVGLYAEMVNVAYRFEGRWEMSIDMQATTDQYVMSPSPDVIEYFHDGFRNTPELWFQVGDLPVGHLPLTNAASLMEDYVAMCAELQSGNQDSDPADLTP